MLSGPAAASRSDCLSVVRAFTRASDCQETEAFQQAVWYDGFSERPGEGRHSWSAVSLNGPCPKYATTLREIRQSPVAGNRQRVRLKAITRRVAFDGRYSGDYSVTKETFVCERRNGHWRIFSQSVSSRNDGINQRAAEEFERTGGW